MRTGYPVWFMAALVAAAALAVFGCSKKDDPPVVILDTTPPARVTNLVVLPGGAVGSLRLQWTAVGDDGDEGTADHFEVRYSASAIDEANFASATVYAQTWFPLPPYAVEVRLAVNLVPGQNYHFALRVFDEAGNPSLVSNSDDAVATEPDRFSVER